MFIYLSGPMTGLPQFNAPAFAEATARLRALGHSVFSPAEHDLTLGFDPMKHTGTEPADPVLLRKMLAADVEYITMQAHAICLLPNWQNSRGVRAELALAAALDLPAGSVEDFESNDFYPSKIIWDSTFGVLVNN